jgi:hypothetical protein
MIAADLITKRFLLLGVAAAAILPRQPSDHTWFSIGGNLSHSFRKLLLAIVGVNLSRLVLSGNQEFSEASGIGSDILGVVEVTGLTFLCFLAPYVLQRGLASYFRIIPGQDLKLPLYATALLSFLGVFLSRTVHPNFWALKKIANIVSGPRIIQTLRSYNSFTTRESHGRGFIIGQTVMIVEYWHMAVQLVCALGYAFNDPSSNLTTWARLLEAARSAGFSADWSRVLVHAIFLNQLDELYHTTSFTGPGEDSNNNDDTGNDANIGGDLPLVPLRPRHL